jgi:phosphatidylserine decarboxylase
MIEKLEAWIERYVKEKRGKPWGDVLANYFYRERWFGKKLNRFKFFAPSDGTILYQKIVSKDEQILEIKGKDYSLSEIVQDEEYLQPADKYLVIGIFLTAYDVHSIKAPTRGVIYNEHLEAIDSFNKTMIPVENDLIDEMKLDPDNMEYTFKNERWITSIYNPDLDMKYNVVLIADREVNQVVTYKNEQWINQSDNYAKIIMGSQTDLIIPIYDDLDYKLLVPTDGFYHIEGGIDALVEVVEKEDIED